MKFVQLEIKRVENEFAYQTRCFGYLADNPSRTFKEEKQLRQVKGKLQKLQNELDDLWSLESGLKKYEESKQRAIRETGETVPPGEFLSQLPEQPISEDVQRVVDEIVRKARATKDTEKS